MFIGFCFWQAPLDICRTFMFFLLLVLLSTDSSSVDSSSLSPRDSGTYPSSVSCEYLSPRTLLLFRLEEGFSLVISGSCRFFAYLVVDAWLFEGWISLLGDEIALGRACRRFLTTGLGFSTCCSGWWQCATPFLIKSLARPEKVMTL